MASRKQAPIPMLIRDLINRIRETLSKEVKESDIKRFFIPLGHCNQNT